MSLPVYLAPIAVLAAGWPLLAGTGIAVRGGPAEYEKRMPLARGELGFEFHGKAVPAKDGGFLLERHIVIEVAVFPKTGEGLRVRAGDFRLKVDGGVAELPVSAGEAGAAVKYSDWEGARGVDARIGVGGVVVGGGQPAPRARFPGDPQGIENRLPPRPEVPEAGGTAEATRQRQAPDEVIRESALDEQEERAARAGLIYFRFSKKISKVKKLELVYEGEGGKASVRLK